MAEPKNLAQQQEAFAAHIRDPEANQPPPGIEDRRLKVYRDLFYNNVAKLLASTFPVLRRILSDEAWHALARGYFSRHRSRTPLFLEIPGEFVEYLQNERTADPEDPPFLLELAHYEWVELGLSVADIEPELESIDRSGDLLEGHPAKSPLAWLLSYRFPVHRISADYQPQTPDEQPSHLVAYRTLDDQVAFLEVNAVTARLLEILAESETDTVSGRQILTRIAEEMQHPQPETVINGGAEIMQSLHRLDIILGVKLTNPEI